MERLSERFVGSLIVGVMVVIVGLATLLDPVLGIISFLISIPVFVFLAGRYFNRFFLWLLLYVFAFTSIGATQVVYWLLEGERLVSRSELLSTSIIIGMGGALLITLALFSIIVAAIAVSWYKDEDIKFLDLIIYLIYSALGLPTFSVEVEDGKLRGKDKALERLDNYGGPGKIRIYPGDVVVLHKHGEITRAISSKFNPKANGNDKTENGSKIKPNKSGVTFLNRKEKIKAIIPLAGKGGVNEIKNVMTRDRIPLDVPVFHKATIESANDTRKRLAKAESADEPDQTLINGLRTIVNGPEIGIDGLTCYEQIAKHVAVVASDPWDATKGLIESNLRDVFMSYDSEDLFVSRDTDGDGIDDDFQLSIDERKIDKIEKFITDKIRDGKSKDGVILNFIDIGSIGFPEDISEKMKEGVMALVDARVTKTTADAKVEAARADAKVKELEADADKYTVEKKAEAQLGAAKFRAKAIEIESEAEAIAKARQLHRAIEIMKFHKIPIGLMPNVLEKLVEERILDDEVKEFIKFIGPGTHHSTTNLLNGKPNEVGSRKG